MPLTLGPVAGAKGGMGAPSGGFGGFAIAGKKPHWGFVGWGLAFFFLLSQLNASFFLLGAGLVAWGVLKGRPD